jgi:hypothetical protein
MPKPPFFSLPYIIVDLINIFNNFKSEIFFQTQATVTDMVNKIRYVTETHLCPISPHNST